jgi:hypothetical protein
VKGSTADDPIERAEEGRRALMYCKCSGCGNVARCTPRSDFYTGTMTNLGPLFCEACMLAGRAVQGAQ